MDNRADFFLEAWSWSLGRSRRMRTPLILSEERIVIGHLGKLESMYRESGRYYHDLTHIDDCVSKARGFNLAGVGELALFYHDAVYEAGASDNEARSASLLRLHAEELGMDEDTINYLSEIILATRHVEAPVDPLTKLVVDIDMSMLASDWDIFEENDAKLRLEYAKYSEKEWRAGRLHFLRKTLEKPQIFYSVQFCKKGWHESQARANISRMIRVYETPQ